MKLVDIGADTERAFFSCLHLEELERLEFTAQRREWYAEYKDKGYKAQVLVLDDGRIVGKCHYIPIEYSPFVGQNLLAILCLYVHMYEHHIGDQRRRGYGRFMLDHVEQYARSSGFKGVVAWAMDWDYWNPVSFYEHVGYSRVDQEDEVVVVWKPFCEDAEPPELLRLGGVPSEGNEKVTILVADNQWCNSNGKLATAREAIEGIEHLVEYTEAGPPCSDRIIHLGYVGGVFLDGKAYRPYQLIGDSGELRAEIVRLYERKQQQV
ncbi:MAG: GNAT family N-acetyltransferase [Chloroflexota bacterium]|nr:GNAT family N-acetyltransferase [Chloroflexota bacterium]